MFSLKKSVISLRLKSYLDLYLNLHNKILFLRTISFTRFPLVVVIGVFPCLQGAYFYLFVFFVCFCLDIFSNRPVKVLMSLLGPIQLSPKAKYISFEHSRHASSVFVDYFQQMFQEDVNKLISSFF